MGKQRISSQEIAEYTNINATQIRRDLSAFGKFGKRGVGYIIVGVLAVPATGAQQAADDLVASGVKIIFNYSEALLETPADVTVHTSNPAVELLYALYFHLT